MATKVTVPDQYSPEDVQEALKVLEQARARKAAEKARRNDPANKERQKLQSQRQLAKTRLRNQKISALAERDPAVKAAIEVTEAEIADYLASKTAV